MRTDVCRRFTHLLSWRQIVHLYELRDGAREPADHRSSYNIAPSQKILIIRNGEAGREPAMLAWGLIPFWSRERLTKSSINVKSETIAAEPDFSSLFQSRRCLMPVSGFFVWQSERRPKQPFYVGMVDGRPFSVAGIWDCWKDTDGGAPVESFAVITCGSNALMAPIHTRMPVIIAPGDHDAWLMAEPEGARNLLRPYPSNAMKAYPISTRVNRIGNDGPKLLEPLV
jgi:putative SOS response-associated peptidase YedK